MSRSDHHLFEMDDAAYLLGALDPEQAQAFRSHLATCAECTQRVDELKPVVALLGTVSAEDIEGAATEAAPPENLLAGVATKAARQRRRQRWSLAAVGGVAAAAVIAVIVLALVLVGRTGGASTTAAGPVRAMVAVQASSPIKATASVTGQPWGTEVQLDCRYPIPPHGYASATGSTVYLLQVYDSSGHRHDLGSWALRAGGEMHFTGGVSLSPSQITHIQIALADGTPVLGLNR